MPLRTRTRVFGNHAHITGFDFLSELKLLSDSVFLVLSHPVFDHSQRFEVLAVIRHEKLHLRRHENPGALILQEASGQTAYLSHLAKVDSGVDVNAIVTLPHTHTEVVVAALQVDKGDVAASLVLVAVRIFQSDGAPGIDFLERARSHR